MMSMVKLIMFNRKKYSNIFIECIVFLNKTDKHLKLGSITQVHYIAYIGPYMTPCTGPLRPL